MKLMEPLVISIVDDDRLAREAVGEIVQSLGYQALMFTSAEKFLECERFEDVVCLITDLQMPDMNGLDLQSCLRARGCNMPIIFISAFPEDESRERALNDGAIAFLSKPFGAQSLIDCIEMAVAQRRPQ